VITKIYDYCFSLPLLFLLLLLQIIKKFIIMKKVILLLLVAFVSFGTSTYSQDKKDDKQIKVIIHTAYGDMTAVLYNETPQHRDNFIKLINEGWYENSPFHRIIQGFMIQGGQNADGRLDPGYTIPAEFVPGKFHKKGALAAARMPDNVNPEKASSGSQFYIVQGKVLTEQELNMYASRYNLHFTSEELDAYTTVGGTPHLDGDYTVFGEVIDGFDVIDAIASVNTGKGGKPLQPVTMTIEIVEE
jgi:peptidyl-prolyl cis-trans isomerase B (cyclophilin B)